jgi:hypothetical protein
MKKDNLNSNFFKLSKEKFISTGAEKLKTTDINILLNRVRKSKKIEFKKRIICSLLLLFLISSLGIFSLFQ